MNHANDNPIAPLSHEDEVRTLMRDLFGQVVMAPIPPHMLKIALDMIPGGIFEPRPATVAAG